MRRTEALDDQSGSECDGTFDLKRCCDSICGAIIT